MPTITEINKDLAGSFGGWSSLLFICATSLRTTFTIHYIFGNPARARNTKCGCISMAHLTIALSSCVVLLGCSPARCHADSGVALNQMALPKNVRIVRRSSATQNAVSLPVRLPRWTNHRFSCVRLLSVITSVSSLQFWHGEPRTRAILLDVVSTIKTLRTVQKTIRNSAVDLDVCASNKNKWTDQIKTKRKQQILLQTALVYFGWLWTILLFFYFVSSLRLLVCLFVLDSQLQHNRHGGHSDTGAHTRSARY